MPTTSQGIWYPGSSDAVTPLETAFSTMASSIDNILAGDVQIHKVANTTARNALVSQFPPSASNPLFVWRADAPSGRELEYTKNGTTWHYVNTSEDPQTGLTLSGVITVAAGATSGSQSVTFSPAFPSTPVVVAMTRATTVWAVNTSAHTATGFTANVYRLSGTGAQSVSVGWIAHL